MDFLKGDKSPSSEALLPVDAREKTADGKTTLDNQQRPPTVGKMAYARRTFAVLLVCMLVLLGVSSASPWVPCHKRATDQQTSESSSFSAKVKAASPASLHDLLHRYLPDRFRDGVFESEHKAMEAIHQEDPALATSILKLAKRDDSNATATSSGPPPTESTSETPTQSQTSEPPSETTTTSTPSKTSKTSIPPSSTSSSVQPPSTSSSAPPPTSSSESSTPTSSPSSSASDTTLTTTTKPPVTTTSPPVSSKETTQTFTSTSPNGVVVVVTQTNFVPADGGETPAPSSTGVPPTLQNSAARSFSGASILAGALGVAVLFLVI